MAGEHGILVRRRLRWAFLAICGFFLLLHVFIFRDVLLHAPAVMHGDASVVREELVPFFDFSTQYEATDASELTGSEEFRTTYAFWTSWVRYNPILPFTLVLMNALTACILFWAFYRVVRHFSGRMPLLGAYAAALSALLVHLLLMYSKIAHFYTLGFGFGLFALSISLAIEQLFLYDHFSKKHVAAVAVLAFINPAIHYHVIFYLLLGLLVVLQGLFLLAFHRRQLGWFLKRSVWFAVLVSVLSLVPYVLFIHFTTPVNAALSEAPVNYWSIYYSSVPLKYLFSLDSYGHVDLFRYGLYLAPEPRVLTMVVFGVLGSLFFFKQWHEQDKQRKALVILLFIALLASMWMSLGYSTDIVYSFHKSLSAVALLAAHAHSTAGALLDTLLSIFINVLRFPHRFEFIEFYVAGLLLSLGLLWLMQTLQRRGWQPIVSVLAAVCVVAMPLVATPAYRDTFWTGDFNGFLRPYTIPPDLRHIKTILANTGTPNRLFIMPSLESGREIQANDDVYSFLDKYFIYYLNQPAVYTGTGADPANKIVAYLAYRAIAYHEVWWQDVLINDFGVTHIVVPQHLQQRALGTAYLPTIDDKITTTLDEAAKYKPVYKGKDYALYEATVRRNTAHPVLADMSWNAFLKQFNAQGLTDRALYFPAQLHDFVQLTGDTYLMTDNPERSFYTLYAAQPGHTAKPDATLLPFTKDLLASSNFTTNMFSLTTLYSRDNPYNYTHEVVPTLAGLQTSQFIGVAAQSNQKLTMKITVPQDGDYRLALHAASSTDAIAITDGATTHTLHRLAADNQPKDFIDFSYYTADVHLTKGTHVLQVHSADATILAEFITAIPAAQVPADFTAVRIPGLRITQATGGLYRVVLEEKK